MNRKNRKFAFSWGRKLFFGLSWPLSIVLTIIYLRSFVLPQDVGDWVYYISILIGHTGLLNAAVYFLLFCPVILIMPSYYITRLWSLILILALNILILIDALSYSSYHFHIYSFLSKLYMEEGIKYLFGDAGVVALSVGSAIFALLIWIRGEMIWRTMQGRFSNPVKNWYLVLIMIFLGTGHLTYHYGDIPYRLAEVFTFNKHIPNTSTLAGTYARKFFYPVDNLQCQGKSNPNVIFIVIKNWDNDQYNEELMPTLYHMKKHSQSYTSQYAAGMDAESGMFSLLYSVPASYMSFAKNTSPALITELHNRKYEFISIGNEKNESNPAVRDEERMKQFRQWLGNRSGEEIHPYFLFITFDEHASEVDKFIREISISIENEDLLSGTHVVITGAHSETGLIPLLIAQPDRKSGENSNIISQYDLVPSLMQRWWGCKKAFKNASIGLPFDEKNRDWLLVSNKDQFKIIDFKNKNVTSVKNGVVTDSATEPRHELIFAALKLMTDFSRSR